MTLKDKKLLMVRIYFKRMVRFHFFFTLASITFKKPTQAQIIRAIRLAISMANRLIAKEAEK